MEIEGIVIRKTPYKGDDAMVNVLSKGRIYSFLAKGVLKTTSKNSFSTNLFSKSKFEIYKGKEGEFLRVGEVVETYPNVFNDYTKLVLLDFISEVTNNLIDKKDCGVLYEFLDKTLKNFDKNKNIWTSTIIYFAQILKITGYGFDVDSCVRCKAKNNIVGISLSDGGFVCNKCFNETKDIKVSALELKMIRYVFKVDIDNFDKIDFEENECKRVLSHLIQFYNWVSQIDIKSINLLKTI